MTEKLKQRIKDWNDIKYGTYSEDKPLWSTVIMLKTLKPEGYISEVKVKFTSNNPKYTKITYAAVTTAPKV